MNGARSFVLDADDRIDRVVDDQDAGRGSMAGFVGHSLWEYLPGAERLLRPSFDEARCTGNVVDTTVFYAGGTVDLRIVPSNGSLAVRWTRRTELNVRTLATLAESLHTIEAELSAREPARRDRPAPASLRALP